MDAHLTCPLPLCTSKIAVSAMHACQTVVVSAILCAVAGCNGVVSATQAEEKARVLVNEASLIEADQERALLSVFQQDENLAFIAGGGVGDQSGVIYQWNGQELIEEQTPVGPALWWVWGNGTGGVWACGDKGRILRRSDNGRWQTENTPLAEDTILYGIWGNQSGQLWAVGGSYRRNGEQNIILTSAGDGNWTPIVVNEPPDAFTFFKVWGDNPTWIVGDLGWVLRISGNEQTFIQTDARNVLFTVHGHGEDVYAVGGQTDGQIYGLQTSNVIREQIEGVGILNGIYVRDDGWRVAAGEGGTIVISSKGSAWTAEMLFAERLAQRTIHGVSSLAGTLFVGGDLRRMNRGFLITTADFQPMESSEQ